MQQIVGYLPEWLIGLPDWAGGLIFVATSFLTVVALRIVLRFNSAGSENIRQMRENGFGLRAWRLGSLPRHSDRGTIDTMEGISAIGDGSKISSVRSTRTISPEFFG